MCPLALFNSPICPHSLFPTSSMRLSQTLVVNMNENRASNCFTVVQFTGPILFGMWAKVVHMMNAGPGQESFRIDTTVWAYKLPHTFVAKPNKLPNARNPYNKSSSSSSSSSEP
mmetsp:Transcript_43339/g.80592  ORF Transcript_43339/g.80592 Transcript_43339/m.80592 type:complete len:114 (-) Transcript_43339:17-358(-)